MVSGDLVTVISADAARALTDRIKVGVEAVWELICQAYTERAWSALGYRSWDDYCTREFGAARLRLPREERAEVVASLRESGLSIRAIAAATGDSRDTVHKALNSGVRNLTPEPNAEAESDALAEELIAAEPPGAPTESTPGQTGRVTAALDRARSSNPAPKPITGIDGKTYTPPPPRKPRRTPLTDEFTDLVLKLRLIERRLGKLITDDRIPRNRPALTSTRNDLIRFRGLLDEAINELWCADHE